MPMRNRSTLGTSGARLLRRTRIRAMREVGRGVRTFGDGRVRGRWTPLESPDEVIRLMDDDSYEGAVAFVSDAGATFLAPIFGELSAVVCRSGDLLSHIVIESRAHEVPCLIGVILEREPDAGTEVEIDCSQPEGVIRA